MRISIIGAGFSGTALATELATPNDSDLDVCLVGVRNTFGRGVAYGESRPEHLLNVRARQLGASVDNPGEFADWLNLTERGRDSFLPRLAYGEYLQDRLQSAQALSSNLTCLEYEAIMIERQPGGFRIHLADGSDFFSDRVVLALGALPPQRLAGVGPRLAAHARYIGWPWQDGAIDRIPSDARLLIVGTGLTMADVVATLRRREHRGAITALSRHGRLPQHHLPDPSPVIELPPHLRRALATRDVGQLLRAIRSLAPVVHDWRSVIDALRPHTQAFWTSLSPVQRGRFVRHVRSYWEIFRHRLAPQVAAELDELQVSGQLRIRAGRLLRAGLSTDGSGVDTLIRDRGQTRMNSEHYDYLIRATGLDTDISRTTHPLMMHLRESGLVRADAFGLGVETSARYEVMDASGRTVSGLYCLGPLLRSRLWEITAVPELRASARELATHLLESEQASARPRRAAAAGQRVVKA
ncbi:FAD/NAD(P)-binding protein [Luteimonas panaciterrae]|uniref:FAD/NAD(P)-binding protein n=1 Tax=Luteimonas panaciterrae TaxID=363885 RepID=UPI001CFB6899|nr:FAD/NAD(P)-binding protein [Luteimonas panaciterrae]